MQAFDNADVTLARAFANPVVYWIVIALALFYLYAVATNPMSSLVTMLDSNIVKLLFILLILIIAKYSIAAAAILAIGFFIGITNLQRYRSLTTVRDSVLGAYDTVRDQVTGLLPNGQTGQQYGGGCMSAATNAPAAPGRVTTIPVDSACGIPDSCLTLCGGQPMYSDKDPVLPPYTNTEVSGLCTCDVMSAQGLKFPMGYEDLAQGASY